VALFQNREQAGQALAKAWMRYADQEGAIVLALPRGGVPVAYQLAKAIHAPLDIIIVRKLGVPGNRELAMGAIASGGVRIINHDIVRLLNISQFAIDAVAAEEQREIELREQLYREGWPALDVHGRTVIVVDDGIATGATMRAAVTALRERHAQHIVVAAPTAAPDAHKMLAGEADEVVCLSTPAPYIAVGLWYENFTQTSDQEVTELLRQAAKDLCAAATQKMH
jgi:putative phosphoribosyl transferase